MSLSKTLIVGASSGLGRELAYEFAKLGHDLILASPDIRDIAAISSDLNIKFSANVRYFSLDLGNLEDEPGIPYDIDHLVLVAGYYDDNDQGSLSDEMVSRLLAINFVGPVRFCNSMIEYVKKQGSISFISSIAAIRPRANSTVYGASKSGLEFYAESVMQVYRKDLRVRIYRMGYMSTNMTFGKNFLLPKISPKKAANIIVNGIGNPSGFVYIPGWWRGIAILIRGIPQVVFNLLRI